MSSGEFEIKLHIPPDRLTGVRAALARGPVHEERLQARYFDTANGALAREGIVLRLRREGRKVFQTVKAPGDGALHRLEHNAPVLARETRPQAARHAGTDVGRLLTSALRGEDDPDAALREVFRTDIHRTTRSVSSGGTEIELALDVGRISAGRQHVEVAELELELSSGSRIAVLELAAQWCEAHHLWLDVVSKSMRGRRLASRQALPEAVGYEAPRLQPKITAESLVRTAAASALHQVLANASEIATGSYGEDHVHQARVGLRRLRTVLREFEGVASLATGQDRAVLTSAFRALGRARDAQHVLPALLDQMKDGGGPPLLLPVENLPPATDAVQDVTFQCVLLRLLAQVETDGGRLAGCAAAREAAALPLQHLYRHIRHATGRFADLDAEARHGLRKRVKSLRYLADATAPLYPRKAVTAFLAALKPLQDGLGACQDVGFGQAFWAQRTAADPASWFALGWLRARQQALLAECRQACKVFRKNARPFWA